MALRYKTDFLVVHGAWTRPDMDIGVAEIEDWHKKRGFDMIGYHFVIRRNGALEHGRPIELVGAHVKGMNFRSLGVCLVGGRPSIKDHLGESWAGVSKHAEWEFNYTQAQMETLKALHEYLSVIYPNLTVLGHKDHSGTRKLCPGFDVRQYFSRK